MDGTTALASETQATSRKREAEDPLPTEEEEAQKTKSTEEKKETWEPASEDEIAQRRLVHAPRKGETTELAPLFSSSSPSPTSSKVELTFASSVPSSSSQSTEQASPSAPANTSTSSASSATSTPIKFDFKFNFDFKTPVAPAIPSLFSGTPPDFSSLFSSSAFGGSPSLLPASSSSASSPAPLFSSGTSSLFGIHIAAPSSAPSEGKTAEQEKPSPAVPILKEPIAPTTGEEGETRVLTTKAKLYVLEVADKSSRWRERGVGQLHLNVSPDGGARLVMRTDAIFRLVLNARIFPGMDCEKVQDKSIRISVLEDGKIVPYLIRLGKKEEAVGLFEKINQFKKGETSDTKQVGSDGKSESTTTTTTTKDLPPPSTDEQPKEPTPAEDTSLPPEDPNI